MNRKKPALTSPWKVGFLVALLLVVTALGVSYIITGTFGVSWHWLEMGGPSPATWTFNPGAFVEEMAPLVGLTALLAFCAHVMVAGAVRRYKSYVESGADYRQLLKSIKSIEDLEDEQLLESLKQHPELREFFAGIKSRVAAFERHHAERDRRGPERAPEAGTGSHGGQDRAVLASECAILASAVMNGKDGIARELALNIPELKQIERALRHALTAAEPSRAGMDSARGELEALRASLRGAVESVGRDADACVAGARELEVAAMSLRQAASEPAGVSAEPAVNPAAVLKQVDATADAMAALGEEARRIAIASALQASGGSDGDAIRVADEVRAIATRFNSVAQQWKQAAPVLRRAVESGGAPQADESARSAAGAVAGKASLWSERAVALREQVRVIERAIGAPGASAPAAEPAPQWDAPEDAIETSKPIESFLRVPETPAAEAEDFVTSGASNVFEAAAGDDAPFAEIPGFEKEHRFFAEPEKGPLDDEPADEAAGQPAAEFVVGQHDGRDDEAADAPAPENIDELADEAHAPATTVAEDGFLTGPRPVETEPLRNEDRHESRPAPRPHVAAPAAKAAPVAVPLAPGPAREPVLEPVGRSATAMLEPEAAVDADADAVDLYALGAIDYVGAQD